jgi:biopolymer transport protein ExbB
MWMSAISLLMRRMQVSPFRPIVVFGPVALVCACLFVAVSHAREVSFPAKYHSPNAPSGLVAVLSPGVWVTQDTGSGSGPATADTKSTLPTADRDTADLRADDEPVAAAPQRSMLQMMFTGNIIGVIIVVLILLLSVLSCILIVENAISLRRNRLLPPDVMQALESALALRDTRAAMMICNDVDNHSMATQVVLAGLERFRSSEFGFAEYRSAVEEAGEHITGRLYRKVEILNVIASIAPMLGLTGTVIGMIDAFNTIAAKQGVAGPEDLAGGIGQALITTLLGLVVAIPTMVAFSYFRTKIDALVSEAGTRIERLMLPLGRRKSSS